MITSQDNINRGKEIEEHLSNVNMELWFNIHENYTKKRITMLAITLTPEYFSIELFSPNDTCSISHPLSPLRYLMNSMEYRDLHQVIFNF